MSDVFTVTPLALAACIRVLDGVPPGDLERPTPCPDFTVADVIDHLHLAMTRLAARAGADLRVEDDLPSLVVAALAAWEARGLDGTLDLRGPLAARRVADVIPLELVVHGWDVATATDRPFEVDAEVVAYLLDAAREIVPDRRGTAFGYEVTPAPGASPLRQLIAFTGRG